MEFDMRECIGRRAQVDVILVERPGGMRYNYTDNPRPPKPSFTGRPLRDGDEDEEYRSDDTVVGADTISDVESSYLPW